MPSYAPFSARTIGTRSKASLGVFRVKTDASPASKPWSVARDGLIGALGHRGAARRHVDAIRRGRFDIARDDEQRGQRVTKVGRTKRKQREGGDCHHTRCGRVAANRRFLDAAAVVDVVDTLHRAFDQLAHQRRRHLVRASGALGLEGRDDRRLEGGLVLLEIERDLIVAHLAHQRTNQEPAGASCAASNTAIRKPKMRRG